MQAIFDELVWFFFDILYALFPGFETFMRGGQAGLTEVDL